MTTQTQCPEQWHRVCAKHMAEMRGWGGEIPAAVAEDIFATMVRQESERWYSRGDAPVPAAIDIQNREWDNP